jgi:hypothetical protein
MKLSTKVGLGFAGVGFLLGFFDRQIFGQSNVTRVAVILGLGLLCFTTMFALSRRNRSK